VGGLHNGCTQRFALYHFQISAELLNMLRTKRVGHSNAKQRHVFRSSVYRKYLENLQAY
jgi:hypothetical protein